MKNNQITQILNEVKKKDVFPDFAITSFFILILAIDFLPYFKSLEIINPQFVYLSVINLIVAIYLYFNRNLISPTIFPILKKSYTIKLYIIFIFLCLLSFLSAKNNSLVFTKLTEILIIFCLFINLLIILKDRLDFIYKIAFVVSVFAFFQSFQELVHFIYIPKKTLVNDLLTGLKGNTGNINILAASLTIKIPFILLSIIYFKGFKRVFLTIALFSVITIILLTGARTPLINLFLILTIYVIYLLKEYSFKRIAFVKISYAAIAVASAIIFSSSIFKNINDNNNRYVSLENKIRKINTTDESSKLRLVYWENGMKMIKKDPFLGVGLGNYQVQSIPYEKATSGGTIISLHAHNDFIEIASETGIINGLIYLSIFVFLFIVNLKSTIKLSNKDSQMTALLSLMVLIVYGIDSIFNFPMYRPTMAIFFSLLLALSIIVNFRVDYPTVPTKKFFKTITLILISVLILTSFSSFIIYKASSLELLLIRDDINSKSKGALTGDEVIDKMTLYPNVMSTSGSFYEYAGIYYVREKNYEKANKCFVKANKINPYLGRVSFYKYVMAQDQGNLDSSCVYIKQAFYYRPKNFSFYEIAMIKHGAKGDTLELLKMHKLFTYYDNSSTAWNIAATQLRNAGYSRNNLFKFIDQGLKLFPNDSTLLTQKNKYQITNYIVEGQKYETLSNFDKALQSYQNALKLDKKDIYALQNIGFYYYNRGEQTKAINYLVEALKYPGLVDGKTEYFLGICYLGINEKENAYKYLNISKNRNFITQEQLISLMQNVKSTTEIEQKRKNDLLIADFITIGQKFEKENKFDEALKFYQKALKDDSKNIYAFQNIGFFYFKTGQYVKGINNLLNALKYPGLNDGKTEYYLAICYLNANDKNNACKYFNISKEKNFALAQQAILENCK